jgi:thiosulfate dehydrogenase (quinone) large subunit
MKQPGNMKNKPNMAAGQRSPAPAMKPSTTTQPKNPPTADMGTPAKPRSWWTTTLLADRFLLPLRLFLGITFIYAGLQKLTDPQFFNRSATGFIGKQIIGFAARSPIHDLLINIVLPHAVFFGALVAFGELAIGIGALLGLLLRPASFFGLLLNILFFLSASWRVYPYFYGADIVFVFCWITLILAGPLRSGLPSLDALLVPRLLMSVSPDSKAKLGPVLNFLLGVGEKDEMAVQPQGIAAQATSNQGGQTAVYNSTVRGYPQGVPQYMVNNQGRPVQGIPQQQKQVNYRGKQAALKRQESRRGFLWGLFAGGLAMLGITFVGGKALQVLQSGGDDSASSLNSNAGSGSGSTSGSATATAPAGSTPGATTAIAKVSAVPDNSAVSFTLPSNGDPGVLIHLNNGKFVAFDATCTHAGCPVQYDPSSRYLICPCHGAEFDPANNAAVVGGPTNTPLTSVPITANNATGAITIQQ